MDVLRFKQCFVITLCVFCFFLQAGGTYAAEKSKTLGRTKLTHYELANLRDVICSFETRGAKQSAANQAVSRKQALGTCQILPTTAAQHGCNWWGLVNPVYAKMCSLRILIACPDYTWRHGKLYTRAMAKALCYNPARWYAKTVAVLYAEHVRNLQRDNTISLVIR